MDRLDIQRRICLPVFDPSYKPNGSRDRLLLLQQQQQPRHRRSVKICSPRDVCQRPYKTSRVADKTPKDSVFEKKEKGSKLKREKVSKWRSFDVDAEQRRSNSDDSVTKGRIHYSTLKVV